MGKSSARVSDKSPLAQLEKKINTKSAQVGVIGLGYVGLPLAVEFAKSGFNVIGIDVDEARVINVNRAKSYIADVSSQELLSLKRKALLRATTTFSVLKDMDAIIICVPTPLRKTREPDISFILQSVGKISKFLRKGQLIVLESTTYPGTTDEVALPVLESKGLKAGKDFSLAFSPERVDPGNANFKTQNIPKVIGGLTPVCQRLACALYSKAVEKVIPVSSTKAAEMVKLLENTFRAVNIGLANEMAIICDRLGLDVWEVIQAAKTKPFGFMAFYPGPGIGGHCIPSDPMYLAWKVRTQGFEARFIELADQINRFMPSYVVEKVVSGLNECRKTINGAKILLVGLAYKKDVSDTRDSPAFDVADVLLKRGAIVSFHDPYVPKAKLGEKLFSSEALNAGMLKKKDCVVILTNHSRIDYELILTHAMMIVDTRNQYSMRTPSTEKVRRI